MDTRVKQKVVSSRKRNVYFHNCAGNARECNAKGGSGFVRNLVKSRVSEAHTMTHLVVTRLPTRLCSFIMQERREELEGHIVNICKSY